MHYKKEKKDLNMQVIISVCGKFWSFELAKQLLKRNYLKKLITSYPKFLVINDGIPKNKISSVSFIEFANRMAKNNCFYENSF